MYKNKKIYNIFRINLYIYLKKLTLIITLTLKCIFIYIFKNNTFYLFIIISCISKFFSPWISDFTIINIISDWSRQVLWTVHSTSELTMPLDECFMIFKYPSYLPDPLISSCTHLLPSKTVAFISETRYKLYHSTCSSCSAAHQEDISHCRLMMSEEVSSGYTLVYVSLLIFYFEPPRPNISRL